MPERPPDQPDRDRDPEDRDFAARIERKERRRLKARREGERDVTFWLGMFGLVGWSVALPTVLLTALGAWIDSRYPSRYSWTLMLLFVGIVIGCLNAWYWIQKESRDD